MPLDDPRYKEAVMLQAQKLSEKYDQDVLKILEEEMVQSIASVPKDYGKSPVDRFEIIAAWPKIPDKEIEAWTKKK